MIGQGRMNGPMKNNKWNWILHAILAILVLVSVASSVSNLYGPSALNDLFSQANQESNGETTTELNNMAISNETTNDNSTEEVEIIASKTLILHSEMDEYVGIDNSTAMRALNDVPARLH